VGLDWTGAAGVLIAVIAGLLGGSCAVVLITAMSLAGGRRLQDQQPDRANRLRAADLIPVSGWLRLRRQDRYRQDPDRQDPDRQDPDRQDPDRQDWASQDPDRQDPDRQDPDRQGRASQDPDRQAEAGAWYLAAGLTTAALFVALWLRFGLSPVLPALCYLAVAGLALAFIDARHRRLPDVLTLPSYPIALILLSVAALFVPDGGRRLGYGLAGMAAAWLFFVLQAFIYPAGVGWGDVKLSGTLGLYLGWFGARALLVGLLGGYLLAAVTGIGLLLAGRATRKSMLPFGPFLLVSTMAVILAAGHRFC
jgi:prepilin signal peptidase PulO-like enzyme (type II secretory pathway)